MPALSEIFERWRWHYIGTAHGETQITDKGERTGKTYQQYWILTERADGKRAAKCIGTDGYSQHQIKRRAQVAAWLRGGPLPPLEDEFMNGKPPRGQLVVFTGGKGDAA